jgi:hypothetical protein
MEVKQDYAPPVEVKQRKTIFTILLDFLSLLLIPFKFARSKLQLIKEDNAKIARFEAWRKKENARYKRGIKLNDEF